MGASHGADVSGPPSPRPRKLKPGRIRRHSLSSLHTQSSVPPPKSRGGACLAVLRHKDHARWRSGLWLRWGLDAHGQRTAAKPALAQENQAPEGSVQSRRKGLTPWPLEPPHLPKVHNQFADFP